MKKIRILAFLPLAFCALTSASNVVSEGAGHLSSDGKALLENVSNDATYIESLICDVEFIRSGEDGLPGQMWLYPKGDAALDQAVTEEKWNVSGYHFDDSEVNFKDYVVFTNGSQEIPLRDVMDSTEPYTYNKWIRRGAIGYKIQTDYADLFGAGSGTGGYSNTWRIVIKEGCTLPSYSYGSVQNSTEKSYIKTIATSVFSYSRGRNVSFAYKVKDQIDITYIADQTDSSRIADYKSFSGVDDVTGLVIGFRENGQIEEIDANANIYFNTISNNIVNGTRVKINDEMVIGEREIPGSGDTISRIISNFWVRWYANDYFVNGTQDSIESVEILKGMVFPVANTGTSYIVGGTGTGTDTFESAKSKIAEVFEVANDVKFLRNENGGYIIDTGATNDTTIEKAIFRNWNDGSRFLEFKLSNSDYKDYEQQGLVPLGTKNGANLDQCAKYDILNKIEFINGDGTKAEHITDIRQSEVLFNYFKNGEEVYEFGIRIKSPSGSDSSTDYFPNVRAIKLHKGLQFPSVNSVNQNLHQNDWGRFEWSRPELKAYTLQDDVTLFIGEGDNYVQLSKSLESIAETDIPNTDLIHNIGLWKPDHSGHAVKGFDQDADNLQWVKDINADKKGLYFSKIAEKSTASEVRFYLPENGYKTESKQYIVKGWSFDYCITDANSVKGTEDGSTYVGNNYTDGAEGSYPGATSTTTSYMLQYIADDISEPGKLAYYCYDGNLNADGKWHTCTIDQYCPTVYGLNIKLFKFQGEFVVANVQCDIDTHVDTLDKVNGTPATCTADGFKDCYRCSVCGKYFTDNTAATEISDYEAWKLDGGKIAATGHEYGEVSFTWNGDQCTASKSCIHTGCTDTQTETKTGTWVQETPATCLEAETGHYTVTFTTVCTDTKTSETISRGEPLGHDFDGEITYTWNEDVCTASWHCQNTGCDEVQSEEASLENGKVYFETEIDPTCTTPGVGYYIATFDITEFGTASSEEVVIPATGHTPVHKDGNPPTCCDDGFKEYYQCSVCGDYFMDEACTKPITDLETWKTTEGENGGKIPATGKHTGVKVEGKAATCTEAGYRDCYKCNACNQYFEDEACTEVIENYEAWKIGDGKIDPTGHTLEKVNGKVATCTEAGYRDYYKCSTCNALFEDAEGKTPIADLEAWKVGAGKIAATGHKYVHHDEVKATKEAEGMKEHYTCEGCDKYFVKEGETYKEVTKDSLIIPKVKGGCGGSIIGTSVAVSTAAIGLGILLIVKKRKEKKA